MNSPMKTICRVLPRSVVQRAEKVGTWPCFVQCWASNKKKSLVTEINTASVSVTVTLCTAG